MQRGKMTNFSVSSRFLQYLLNWNATNSMTYCKCTAAVRYINISTKNLFINNKDVRFSHSKFIYPQSANVCTAVEKPVCETTLDESDLFGNLNEPLEKQKNYNNFLSKSNPSFRKKHELLENVAKKSDTFGTLSEENQHHLTLFDIDEEADDDSTVEFPLEKEYKSPKQYLEKMKQLVKGKKLKQALELFPHMKKHFVKPEVYNYTFMIGACGRAGYTEMAFKLLRQMTDRGLRPTSATLSGLFNACAECPFPEYGLQKATLLKRKIVEKNWLLNKPSYHAMIKAFGKCGDIETAFQIVDEMASEGLEIDCETFNFLLISCISNKDAGFTLAVQVWRKMLSKKRKPDIFTFNLLLRAVRDCDIGTEETSSLLLQHWSSYNRRPYGLNESKPKSLGSEYMKLPNIALPAIEGKPEAATKEIISGSSQKETTFEYLKTKTDVVAESSDTSNHKNKFSSHSVLQQNNDISASVSPMVCPNILLPRPTSEIESINILSIKQPSDRLALFGGAEGFLQMMKKYKVKPDIKTFTLLLENLPQYKESETMLVDLMETFRVKPDTDFFNILIKKRNFRKDFTSAQSVLSLINKHNLSTDIVTFGVLSLGCFKKSYGIKLLRDMKRLGVHPNIEIMGSLVSNACKAMDFSYLCDILKIMKNLDIKPNERVLLKLEEFMKNTRQAVLDKEKGKEVAPVFASQRFLLDYHSFYDFYNEWLKSVHVEMKAHPWDQYKTDIIARVKRQRIFIPPRD